VEHSVPKSQGTPTLQPGEGIFTAGKDQPNALPGSYNPAASEDSPARGMGTKLKASASRKVTQTTLQALKLSLLLQEDFF